MSLHATEPEVWEDAPVRPAVEFHDDCFGTIRTDANGCRYCDACGEDV